MHYSFDELDCLSIGLVFESISAYFELKTPKDKSKEVTTANQSQIEWLKGRG